MSQTVFTKDHEWVQIEGDVATIGISDYAQHSLGDIVFVELPEVGDAKNKGDEAAVVESVKAASEVYAPLSGEVSEVNSTLEENAALVNSDPEGEGWFFRLKISDAGELEGLMDKDSYADYVKGLD